MKICFCESCHYTFRYPVLPPSCPDCGKEDVRIADGKEAEEYHRIQAVLAEEIRTGLYAAAG